MAVATTTCVKQEQKSRYILLYTVNSLMCTQKNICASYLKYLKEKILTTYDDDLNRNRERKFMTKVET